MTRLNVGILGISELKSMGMGEFNSDDHYIYYCGQEALRRNGVVLTVNKWVWNVVLVCNLKTHRMISVCIQDKSFSIIVIQVYAPTADVEEVEVNHFIEDLQHLLELTHPKNVFFTIGDQNAKAGSEEIPWMTGKLGLRIKIESTEQRLEVLTREHNGHRKHPFPTT